MARTTPLVAGLLVVLLAGAGARGADPCGLVGKNDVAGVLGGPVLATTPAGPIRDEATGGRTTMCTYDAAGRAVVVSVTTYGTPEAAAKATTRERVAAGLEGSGATVGEEGGLGDRALFGTSSNGASWVVVRGATVVGVAIRGAELKNSASYKGRLRALAASALGGL